MFNLPLQRLACARIPTDAGEFQLCLYGGSPDGKEHLALALGDVLKDGIPQQGVLVRVHSECFTGDVLGSRRCDCGDQLQQAMTQIAAAGSGVILYLRQEGRGIGLVEKLKAYNLQDQGYDTVDANLALGHGADERDYTAAAAILSDLNITSVRLLTNNPSKIESLERLGIHVVSRVPIQPSHITADNATYLNTKISRMRHLLKLDGIPYTNGHAKPQMPDPIVWLRHTATQASRPRITLSYAQTLDGAITAERGRPLPISGPDSLTLTHQLRAAHQAILVGVGTVLADNPRLNVRLAEGDDPQPIVLDSTLRTPPDARLLHGRKSPLIATSAAADPAKAAALQSAGATIVRLPTTSDGCVSLPALMRHLYTLDISSVMVEGGARVIHSFLAAKLVDAIIITLSMQFLGGLAAVGQPLPQPLRLQGVQQRTYGNDLVIWGTPERDG